MKVAIPKRQNGNLSSVQLRTFKKFQRKLKEKVPDYRITWVHPYNESILEVGMEFPPKLSYRKLLRASKVATEVEDETGVTIVLR